MKYAIIETGTKQYRVEENQSIQVELLGEVGTEVVFDHVLLIVDQDSVEVGTPYLNTPVHGTIESIIKGDKIEVFKYKSKSRYRKHTGHRQQYAVVKITAIGAPVKPQAKPKAKASTPSKKSTPRKSVSKTK